MTIRRPAARGTVECCCSSAGAESSNRRRVQAVLCPANELKCHLHRSASNHLPNGDTIFRRNCAAAGGRKIAAKWPNCATSSLTCRIVAPRPSEGGVLRRHLDPVNLLFVAFRPVIQLAGRRRTTAAEMHVVRRRAHVHPQRRQKVGRFKVEERRRRNEGLRRLGLRRRSRLLGAQIARHQLEALAGPAVGAVPRSVSVGRGLLEARRAGCQVAPGFR